MIAVYAELIDQNKKYSASVSDHVGSIGEKINLNLTIQYVKGFSGTYGTTWIHIMKDETDNVVVYKGSKFLGNKEQKINIIAKVKEHTERDEIKQTVIERPVHVADIEKKKAQKLYDKNKPKSSSEIHLELLKKGKTDEEIVAVLKEQFPEEEIIPAKISHTRVHWRRTFKSIPV
jgi:hypothetical protein